MIESADRDKRLETVLDAYLRSVEDGRPIGRKEVLAASPDLAPELEEFFAGQDWMHRAVKSAREVPAAGPLPFRFGKYDVIEEVGRGGMGVVYKARDLELKNRLVALKVIRFAKFASAADVARFRTEAESMAELEHPNIVPIHEFGEHEGQPYFTMKLIEGESLQQRLSKYRDDPRAAARLMVTVAGAIRYANRRAILHRDLKPGNILLDAEGQPHVTDFGLAKRLDGAGEVTARDELVGTLAYMAPEQVSGQKRRLSLAVDVHGLGTVLYALLTGRPPFLGATFAETIRKIQHEEPELDPKVDADLAAICLKCLRKDPAQRYENAGAFAADLERWLEGRPVQARPVGRAVRFGRWCRRHAGGLALGATAALLLLSMGGHLLVRKGVRQERLTTDATMAQHIADRFRRQLREWSDRLVKVAEDPELVSLLEWSDFAGLQIFCDRAPFDLKEFESWTVLDAEGTMRARVPSNLNIGGNFEDRDYFKGPLEHQERGLVGAHVSRAFRTSHAEAYNIALSAPIHRNGTVLGVLRVSVSTGTTLGLTDLPDPRRRVVVVAPWDTSKPQEADDLEPGYRIVYHPLLVPGQKPVPLRHPYLETLGTPFCEDELALPKPGAPARHAAGYRDPVDGGSWLAGFAPIGNTGFVVIVQQQDE